jgi:hypothetical protein
MYRTMLFPVLYGCETGSVTVRVEHRLRIFKNKVLRKVFGLKREDVTGDWRILHNEELHDLYSTPVIIQVIRSKRKVGGSCDMGARRVLYGVLMGKSVGRDHLGDLDVDESEIL